MIDFDPATPYNHLPNLPPERDIESRMILKKCIGARAALAELKAAGDLIPNQTILINTLPLLEAKGSSEIENIVTTTDQLFRFAQVDDDKADGSTKEALRYRTALHEGVRSIQTEPINIETIKRICSTIKGQTMDLREKPGTSLANDLTGERIYTPPSGKDLITEKLANWISYIQQNDDVDPLIKMAVSHYQFEAIHPFSDGNGRTGRILNLIFLVDKGLLSIPILYLSKYIIENKSEYYTGLLNVTQKGEWTAWIYYMLSAVESTSNWTTRKINAVKTLMQETAQSIKSRLPKIYSHELVELLFSQPYCRIGNLVDADIAKRQTASEYLKQLSELNILEEKTAGREKLFINPALMALLER